MFVRHRIVTLLVVALASLAARGQTPTRPAGSPALPDLKLETAIRQRLAASKCAQDKFTVHVQGGVATLEGKTEVIQRKGAATRMAKAAGAKQVINKIQVNDAAVKKAAANLTTGRRRAQIKRSETKRAP